MLFSTFLSYLLFYSLPLLERILDSRSMSYLDLEDVSYGPLLSLLGGNHCNLGVKRSLLDWHPSGLLRDDQSLLDLPLNGSQPKSSGFVPNKLCVQSLVVVSIQILWMCPWWSSLCFLWTSLSSSVKSREERDCLQLLWLFSSNDPSILWVAPSMAEMVTQKVQSVSTKTSSYSCRLINQSDSLKT